MKVIWTPEAKKDRLEIWEYIDHVQSGVNQTVSMWKTMKSKITTMIKLDAQEQELLDAVESGEWKRVSDFEHQMDFAKKAAVNTLRKNARNNILISREHFDSK